MIKTLYLTLLLIFTAQASPIVLETPLRTHNILHDAKVFFDVEGNSSVEGLLDDPSVFKAFDADKIDLGYTTGHVWVMFTLENSLSETLRPMLVLDNPMLDHIRLYSFDADGVTSLESTGLLDAFDFSGRLNFDFKLSIEPNNTRHYLLQVDTTGCALYFDLTVMEQEELFNKELRHQLMIVLFIGAILGLIVYNFFIYFFTKDRTYLYYVGYQTFIILNYASLTTITKHLFEPWFISADAFFGIYYVMGAMVFALLFTRSFLELKRFKRIDIVIKVLGALGLLIMVVSATCCYVIDLSVYLALFASIYLIGISLYVLLQGEPHAKYFVFGWGVMLAGTISLSLYQMGMAPYMDVLPYLYESGVAFEAILFSVILARRLNDEKALSVALSSQKVLVRELQHRVMNNMQLIISLYRLKFLNVTDKVFKRRLEENENNIIAMSTLHEMLYTQKDLESLDMQSYFQRLVDTMSASSRDDAITIDLNCHVSLGAKKAIVCGILLNELLGNSIKHAFEAGKKGHIKIGLFEERDGHVVFEIEDDGRGYDQKETVDGFGLMLTKALAQGDLHASLKTDTKAGTRHRMVWSAKSSSS